MVLQAARVAVTRLIPIEITHVCQLFTLAVSLYPCNHQGATRRAIIAPMTHSTPFAARRARLAAQLGEGGVAVIPTAPEQRRNRDNDYPYRHDSYFYYLTGSAKPVR